MSIIHVGGRAWASARRRGGSSEPRAFKPQSRQGDAEIIAAWKRGEYDSIADAMRKLQAGRNRVTRLYHLAFSSRIR